MVQWTCQKYYLKQEYSNKEHKELIMLDDMRIELNGYVNKVEWLYN